MDKNLGEKIWNELCEIDDRFATSDEYPVKAQECQAYARVFAKELDRLASDFGEVIDVLTTVLQEIKITIGHE